MILIIILLAALGLIAGYLLGDAIVHVHDQRKMNKWRKDIGLECKPIRTKRMVN